MSNTCYAIRKPTESDKHTFLLYDGTNDKELADYMSMTKYRRKDDFSLWLSNGVTTYIGIKPNSYVIDKVQVLSPLEFQGRYEKVTLESPFTR